MILRKAKEANLSLWVHYEFLHATASASLCTHIEKYHLELYLTLVKEEGWKIMLPGLISQARLQAANKATMAQGEQPDDL